MLQPKRILPFWYLKIENNYELHNGDCLKIMKNIPDKSIDCIICDPPFGSTQCKWDSIIPFEPLWEQYKRIIKQRGAICLFGTEPFSSLMRTSNIKWYKYDWIWNKKSPTGHLNAHHRPMRKTENIMVFSNGKTAYFPQGLIWNPRKKTRKSTSVGSDCYGKHGDVCITNWQGYPTEILEFTKETGFHPTQKPVALLEYLIKTYTNEGEIILDNCMGSGSTGVACMNTNREFIGIELDKKYFVIAKNRIEEACK